MSGTSRSKAAFWAILSNHIYTIISMVVSIVSTPLMVKYLDKESYGLFIIFYQIVNYLSLFDFGLSTAVNRHLALHRADTDENQMMTNRIISTAMVMSGVFGVITIIAGCSFAPFLPKIYHLRPDLATPAIPIIVTISLLIAGQFMQRGLGSLFYAHHRQALLSTPLFVISMLTTGLTILLLSQGVGLWSFIYVNIFQFLITLIVQGGMVWYYYPNLRISWRFFDKTLIRVMMGYGFFMFLHGLAEQVILGTDRLVIGKVLTLALVAIFSITVRIPEVVMNLLNSILGNILPALTEIAVHEDESRTRTHFKSIMVLMTSLSILACWLMIILDEWFIHLWVGESFFAGASTLILALVVMVQQVITHAGIQFLNAKGVVQASSIMAVIEATLNIIISIFLGRIMGLNGILLGTIIAALFTSSWYTPYLLRKHLAISFRMYFVQALGIPLIGVSVAGSALFGALYLLKPYMPVNWLVFIIVATGVGILLGSFVWLVFLRKPLGIYVPVRLRRILLVQPVVALSA